jgi:nucleoside-diphosphate-sugar epimerase
VPVSAQNKIVLQLVNILIVGSSGNLRSHLTKHLLSGPYRLRLLTHERTLPFHLPQGANAEILQADLNEPSSLHSEHPRDMVEMAMTSVVAETTRMKRDLMPQLAYPTLDQGLLIV